MWHPSDRLFAKEPRSSHLSHDRDQDAPGSNGMQRTAVEEPEAFADVADSPHTCSYCGTQEFDPAEDTGRGLRAVCSACGGAMLRTEDGQWTPAGPGATNNHPRPEGDPNSGGVGGAANVGVDPDRMNDASARHGSLGPFSVWEISTEHTAADGTVRPVQRRKGARHRSANDTRFIFTPSQRPEIDDHSLALHRGDQELGHLKWRGTDGDISTVDVHRDHRRQGIATQLYTKAHELAQQHGFTGPAGTAFQTPEGHDFRAHFDTHDRPDVSHIPTETSFGSGAGKTDLAQHMIEDHGFHNSADQVRGMKASALSKWHDNVRQFDSCGWGRTAALNDEIPWCAHLYHGNCTYPGDKLPNGTILGIPQDRGPCPWKQSVSMQAVCPISEPGPMAVQFREAGLHGGAIPVEGSWIDVRNKATRIRRAGGVTITIASADGVAGEVRGDQGTYESLISFSPGTRRVASWRCDCPWFTYAFDRAPKYQKLAGRMCSHCLALNYEAQSQGMFGNQVKVGAMNVDEINELVTRSFAEAKARLDGDDDPAEVLGHLITAGIPHDDAQNIVLAARGRVALRKVAKKCPECGAELDATDSQCDDCGAVLPDQSVTHRASWGDDEQRCPHCGGYIGPEAFKIGKCPHCGHALAHKTSSLTDSGDSYHVHEPSGARYRLGEEGYNTAVAYHQLSNGGERRAGYLSWFGGKPEYDGANVDGGVIHKAYVSSPHRRRGVASALLDYARTQHPDQDIRHSRALSDDGKAWAANTASLQTFSVWDVPGWEGAQGPFEDEYNEPHVYARDIHSGAGNCVCGGGLGDPVHLQAAPGVDVPEHQRTASSEIDYRPHRTQDARSDAPIFGKGVDDWGLTLVDCPQCGGKSGCGNCGGTGQVISTGGTTANPTPDQNPVAGDAIREDGISDVSSLHPQFAAKKGAGPSVAGVVLKAADTGRILMLQRGLEDEKDPARGLWEAPGGHIEDGDKTTLHAGLREWEEEVGQPFPEGGVVTHAWTSPNGIYQGHVVVIPRERGVVMHDGRVVPNPDDPSGDHAEQAAWWDPDHARKNPALRPEFKQTPWSKVKEAGADCGLKVEALLQRQGAAWDSLYSLEEAQPVTPPPHSDSENPISSGFLTTQDPQSWSEVTHRPHHLMPADSLDSPVATLHSVPEGALPFTDGDIEDSTSGTTDEYGTQTNDDDTQSLDGDTDGIPDTEQEGSPMEPLGGMASKRSVADIVEQFQRTAGAQMLQSGSGGGSDVGFSDGEIAAKAKERLAGLSKTALKNFTFDEQQELIGEGKGTRARNFGDLDVTGTHYQAINEALAAADLSDDDILIL